MGILYFNNLIEYCNGIGINEPRGIDFDIRRFEINMESIKTSMDVFQHRFYAIALKLEGSGISKLGAITANLEGSYLFFNSPYQLLSWDIDRDWKGYYLMFTEQFIQSSPFFKNFLIDFPFLNFDKTIPLLIENEKEKNLFVDIFERIYQEYHSNRIYKHEIIISFVNTILLYIKRLNRNNINSNQISVSNDLKILTQFQNMVIASINNYQNFISMDNPHSVSFYAKKLNIHPNYLNAIVKKLTGHTALNFIHKQIINHAKSFLLQTDLSVKEIAYYLNFENPNYFNTLFKKLTSITPNYFRKANHI